MSVALVIENDPIDEVCRLGGWLTDAGLELAVARPYAGDEPPPDLAGYAALVVLGHAAAPAAPGLPAVTALLRAAVRDRLPTLGICLGARLLATAHGGTVAPAAAGPEVGPALVGRRDAAGLDPLFARVPFTPDVLQWHRDEITELPAGAVPLAAASHHPHQAYRLGPAAWGLHFHIQADPAMVDRWAAADPEPLRLLGRDAGEVVAACEAVMDDLAGVWQPFTHRFAAFVRGEVVVEPGASVAGGRDLPLLGA